MDNRSRNIVVAILFLVFPISAKAQLATENNYSSPRNYIASATQVVSPLRGTATDRNSMVDTKKVGGGFSEAIQTSGDISFDGLYDTEYVYDLWRPDPTIAVGSNYVFQASNSNYRVFEKASGSYVNGVPLNFWFQGADYCYQPYCYLYSPKAIYDHIAKRWIVIALSTDYPFLPPLPGFPGKTKSFIYLKCSQPETMNDPIWMDTHQLPGKGWNTDGQGQPTTVKDYYVQPSVGYDADFIYVAYSLVSMQNNTIYKRAISMIRKSELYSGGVIYPLDFPPVDDLNITPPLYGDSPNGFYLLSNNFFSGNMVRLYRIAFNSSTNTAHLSWVHDISIRNHTAPPKANQKSSSTLLYTEDSRMKSVVYRDGNLFAAFTENKNWGSGAVAAIRYVKIDTLNGSALSDITYGQDGIHCFFPALHVGLGGYTLLTYNSSGTTEYVGAKTALKKPSDANFGSSTVLMNGTTSYSITEGREDNWGLYNSIVPDPTAEDKFWVCGTYAKTATGWGTRISSRTLPSVNIIVDQKLEDNLNRIGIVKKWDSSSWLPIQHGAPLPSAIGNQEWLLGDQSIISGQKYHWWTDDLGVVLDVSNHTSFLIKKDMTYFISWFKPRFDATIGSLLVDGGYPGCVEFIDPWILDLPDPQHNYQLRNQGIDAQPHTVLYYQDNLGWMGRQGIFKNENENLDPTMPIYYIRAPLVNSDINGNAGTFLSWSYDPMKVTLHQFGTNPLGYDQKAVVFKQAGAIIFANYKGSKVTNELEAFSNSSQRKIVQTEPMNNLPAYLHLVYESAGSVWYEKLSIDGTSLLVRRVAESAKSPSICELISETSVLIVYHFTDYGTANTIKLTKFDFSQNEFSNHVTVYDPSLSPYTPEMNPVVTQPRAVPQEPDPFIVIWKNPEDEGIYYRRGLYDAGNLSFPTPINHMLGTNGHSYSPTAAGKGYYQIAWEQRNADESKSEVYYCRLTDNGGSSIQETMNLSSGAGYDKNQEPSIVDVNSTARVCWLGFRDDEEGEELLAKKAADAPVEVSRLIFRDPESTQFWALGQEAASPTITSKSWPLIGYVLSWSENNGVYNKYTAGGPGATIHQYSYGVATPGVDLQVNNASDFSGMYAMALRKVSTPYAFTKSTNASLPKESSHNPLCTGREAVVHDGNTQVFFALGDITVNSKTIGFKEVPEKLKLSSKDDLNKWLTSKPFEVNDQSEMSYRVEYGILNPLQESGLFVDAGQVAFVVQLIDDKIGQVIGAFDNVTYSKTQILNRNNLQYKIDTKGIGKRTVRMQLVVDAGKNALVSFTTRSTDNENGALGKPSGSTVKQVGFRGTLEIKDYRLAQNYPNPFNPETSIDYDVKDVSHIRLVVYDVLGKEVATLVNADMDKGRYTVRWNASNVTSGVYIYRLTATDQSGKNIFTKSQRMMLMK